MDAGVDLQSPIIAMCLTGVTASTLSLVLEHLGVREVPVYAVSSYCSSGISLRSSLEIFKGAQTVLF